MRKAYVIALDQGTTSSRAMLVDADGRVVDAVQNPFPQRYPQPGWVEHDPLDILSSQLGALAELTVSHGLGPADIDAIGITNQRETTVVWNRETGRPVGNAIVWQCRRTAPIVEELCGDPAVARRIADTTGLVPDAYFSASKVKWLLDNIPGARADAEAGKLAFGTVDSWLVWSLTDGQVHATDVTNASLTMLYDIHEMRWDPWPVSYTHLDVYKRQPRRRSPLPRPTSPLRTTRSRQRNRAGRTPPRPGTPQGRARRVLRPKRCRSSPVPLRPAPCLPLRLPPRSRPPSP